MSPPASSGRSEAVAADLNEIAGRDQRFDVALEADTFIARYFQKLQELASAGGMVHPLAHRGENVITRKHRNSGYQSG